MIETVSKPDASGSDGYTAQETVSCSFLLDCVGGWLVRGLDSAAGEALESRADRAALDRPLAGLGIVFSLGRHFGLVGKPRSLVPPGSC